MKSCEFFKRKVNDIIFNEKLVYSIILLYNLYKWKGEDEKWKKKM